MILKPLIRTLLGHRLYSHLLYRRHYRWLLHHNGFPNRSVQGEESYVAKWRQLSPLVEPYSYRLFSRYCGADSNIIPEDIMHDIVERYLNPPALWDLYEDKNNFASFLDPSILPATVAMRKNGGPVQQLVPLSDCPYQTLFLKPSLDASCGDGILRFDRCGDRYVAADGTILSDIFMMRYAANWNLQQGIVQHPFFARLSPTAVSTVRLAVYRSVVDSRPHVTAAILRVGPAGSHVDNISAGGRFVAIDPVTGRLGSTFIARYGERSSQWNGVDLGEEKLFVPAWQSIVDLALDASLRITDHHLIAFDITVDPSLRPILIEYNLGGFTTYFFHFTGQTPLGSFTDEVITSIINH